NVSALHGQRGFAGATESLYRRFYRAYAWSLSLVLQHRFAMLGVFAAVIAGTVAMFIVVPKGFVPTEDIDSLSINLRAAQGTSFPEMSHAARQVAALIDQNPNVESFFVSTGGSVGSMNTARLNLNLVPRSERPVPARVVAQQLRSRLTRFPGLPAVGNDAASVPLGPGRNCAFNVPVQHPPPGP